MSTILETYKPCNKIGPCDVWDIANRASAMSVEQGREIEQAWMKIPRKYTGGITRISIKRRRWTSASGGSYYGRSASVNLSLGMGLSSVLCHEVHHHMFRTKYNEKQLIMWCRGVRQIMIFCGKSPTRYSDTYNFSRSAQYHKKISNEIIKFKKQMDKGKYTINMCFSEYATLKRSLKLRYDTIDDDMMHTIKSKYDGLSDSDKMQMSQVTLDGLRNIERDATNSVEYTAKFYSESHAETGAYIYEEESMRRRADLYKPTNSKWDHRVNDDVIDAYVNLYKKCFENDWENNEDSILNCEWIRGVMFSNWLTNTLGQSDTTLLPII